MKKHITNIIVGVLVATISGAILFYFFKNKEKSQELIETTDKKTGATDSKVIETGGGGGSSSANTGSSVNATSTTTATGGFVVNQNNFVPSPKGTTINTSIKSPTVVVGKLPPMKFNAVTTGNFSIPKSVVPISTLGNNIKPKYI